MVKEALKIFVENLIGGGLFNHTIILINKENTKFLDFLTV